MLCELKVLITYMMLYLNKEIFIIVYSPFCRNYRVISKRLSNFYRLLTAKSHKLFNILIIFSNAINVPEDKSINLHR